MKKIILKNREGYGPWKSKVTTLLDGEECWEIVNKTETKLGKVARIAAADNALASVNQVAVDSRRGEIKEFRRRFKKADSLITQTVDDSIVMSLDVHLRNPIAIRPCYRP